MGHRFNQISTTPPLILSLFSSKRNGKSNNLFSTANGQIFTELSYNDEFGIPMIEALVNGFPYRFIFDTGASILCVTDRLASAAELHVKHSRYRFKNLQEKLKTTTIQNLALGNITMHNQEAVVLNAGNTIFRLLGVDGIIGGTVLEHFVISFDARRRRITMSDMPDNVQQKWGRFRMWRKLPLLKIGVRDSAGEIYELKALFDSGNGTGNIMIPTINAFRRLIAKGTVSGIEQGEGMTSRMIGGIGSASPLYRGRIDAVYLAGATADDIPAMSGGLAYPLLCWKLSEMGVITLDYPRRRYSFAPYADARSWDMICYPVMTAVEKNRLIVASVWDSQLRQVISPGDAITAIGGTPIVNPSETATPNIDELIPRFVTDENSTVTITDASGVSHILPSRLFVRSN